MGIPTSAWQIPGIQPNTTPVFMAFSFCLSYLGVVGVTKIPLLDLNSGLLREAADLSAKDGPIPEAALNICIEYCLTGSALPVKT